MLNEVDLFLIAGILYLIFEADRQFNHPADARPPSDGDGEVAATDFVSSLSPADTRSRSAFKSAEALYILILLAIYLALVYWPPFGRFVGVMVQLLGGSGGADPGATPRGLPAGAGGVANDPMRTAAAPFVTSLAMVAALRFPQIRKLELLLRSTAQRIFGIPWIPKRVWQRIQDSQIDLKELEEDFRQTNPELDYHEQIQRFAQRAKDSGTGAKTIAELTRNLSKLAVYQIWVNDVKLWPHPDFRSDFRYFDSVNDPLNAQITTLFKDCQILAAAAATTNVDQAKTVMQDELWELKSQQASRLARATSEMMAYYDQNSQPPDPARPGAMRAIAFLESVRAKDDAQAAQVNTTLLLAFICASISFTAGYVHARMMRNIYETNGISYTDATRALFDGLTVGWNFVVTSLIVYGFSMWIAFELRRRGVQSNQYTNPFENRSRIPPMRQFLLMFAATALAVFLTNWLYLLYDSLSIASEGVAVTGAATPANPDNGGLGMLVSQFMTDENVRAQARKSIFFAIIGGFHGTAMALMLDLAESKAKPRVRRLVIGAYVLAMVLLGLGLGDSVGASADQPDANLRAAAIEINQMRMMLYAFTLGMIGLFTSAAINILMRPAGDVVPAGAQLGSVAS